MIGQTDRTTDGQSDSNITIYTGVEWGGGYKDLLKLLKVV